MADNNDRILRHSVSRAQGKFTHETGYVNNNVKKTEGDGFFGSSLDMAPAADRLRFQEPGEHRRTNQRHLKTMSVPSDD